MKVLEKLLCRRRVTAFQIRCQKGKKKAWRLVELIRQINFKILAQYTKARKLKRSMSSKADFLCFPLAIPLIVCLMELSPRKERVRESSRTNAATSGRYPLNSHEKGLLHRWFVRIDLTERLLVPFSLYFYHVYKQTNALVAWHIEGKKKPEAE